MKEFDVNEQGIIQSPGKFEGEMLYVPYFWDTMMEGNGEDLYFSDGALVSIIGVEDKDREMFPELGSATQIAIETTDQGFVNAITDSAAISRLLAEYESDQQREEKIEEGKPVEAKKLAVVEAAEEYLKEGDKVEFPVEWGGQMGFAQGEIASIEGNTAKINIQGDPKSPEWAPLDELHRIENYNEVDPLELSQIQREKEGVEMMASIEDAEDARKVVIQAMGYKDLAAQLRACFLMGLAEQKIWKSAVDQIKKKHEKEMKEKVKTLTKWGTVQPSPAAVKDVIAKVLMAHGISAYPNLIEALYANPFQNRGAVVPETPNETMSEPR